jgi:ABC-type branched-subunit amino acid transport system ATPase component
VAGILLERVTKAFPGGVKAVDEVSLEIEPGAASRRSCG